MEKIGKIPANNFLAPVAEYIQPRLVDLKKTASLIQGLVGERSLGVELSEIFALSLQACFRCFQFCNPLFKA